MEKFQKEFLKLLKIVLKIRSRLQLRQAPRLDEEKEWTSKNIGFRLSDS